jgi:hypothetical protein
MKISRTSFVVKPLPHGFVTQKQDLTEKSPRSGGNGGHIVEQGAKAMPFQC